MNQEMIVTFLVAALVVFLFGLVVGADKLWPKKVPVKPKKARYLERFPDISNPFCDDYLDPQVEMTQGKGDHRCCYASKCQRYDAKECVVVVPKAGGSTI